MEGVILPCRRPKQFREDRLQRIRPYLVSLNCGMKLVVCNPVEQPAIPIRKLVVDVQESYPISIGKFGETIVDHEAV